jgi:Flp pilus assembly protein TadD
MSTRLAAEPKSPPAPAARRSPWIISPVWDVALLVGSPLAIVPALLWLGDHWASPETISIAVLAFASAGHHLPGFLRAYGERDLFRRFRWRFLLAPPLALAVSLAFALRGLHGLALVMLFWATWHGLMQTYGFMRIYDMKRGVRDALTARLDLALCLAIFAGGIVFSDARVANLAETFWLAGGAGIDAQAVREVRIAIGVALVLIVIAYLVNVIRQGRSIVGVSGAKLALALSTGWLYWLGGALSTNVLIGVAMFEVFHALQYYAIVWVYNCRLARRLGEQGGWAGFLFQNRAAFLALYIGAIAAWGLPHFLGGELLSDRLLGILMAVYTASAMLHFYYDGFIWKVRESDVQANLGVESPRTDAASPPRPALQLLKWAALLALLGVLWIGEVRADPLQADDRSIVPRLTAIAGKLPEVQVRASRLALLEGDAKSALAAARSAVVARPRSGEAQYQLGWALLASGQPREAIEPLEEAAALAPNNWRNRLRLAMAHIELKQWDSAEAALSEAKRLAPSEPEVERGWAMLRLRQNDVGAALAHHRSAGSAGATADDFASWAAAEELDGDERNAAWFWGKAIALDASRPEFHLRLGALLHQRGAFSSAAARYAEAARLAPDSFAAWNNLGAMRYELGDAKGAAEAWRRAVKLAPKDAAAHYNLALALLAQGDHERADAEFAKASELAP